MSFRDCSYTPGPPNPLSLIITGGQYDYFVSDATTHAPSSAVPLYYNIMVGNNGSIVRSVSNDNNISYQTITSGTVNKLRDVRISSNPYEDEVAAVGDNGTVLVSDHSGQDWTAKTPVTSSNLYGVDHRSFLFAVGDNGTILFANQIITGSLVAQTSGTTRNLRAVAMVSSFPQRAIVVGEKGTILRTTDTGFNWLDVSIPDTTFDFYDLSQRGIYFGFVTGDIFVAVGSQGKIYKSTDEGATWTQKTSGTTNTLRSIYFHTLDSGVVVGDNGTILFTTNGGESWYTDPYFDSPNTRHFSSVAITNNNYGTYTAMSDSFFIFSEEAVTVTGVENVLTETPTRFALSQNYPNPFNPGTAIAFSIPSKSFVSLKVFDLAGREVSTVISEELPPGNYSRQWNATGLASGIYMYRLETGTFAETKKMVLIK